MLPKNHRINLRKEFSVLKKNGKMLNSESFGLLCVKNAKEQKFGFIVSTKISKKAVERNLIRRRLSEIVRQLPTLPKVSGVFLCKKTILNKNYQELKQEIENIFRKIY
jgi:ribonuclease P protein component